MKIINYKKENENEVSFTITGIDTSIANALRRTMIANVETMTFDIVKIKDLKGLIGDKIIAQRLGLIPLRRKNKLVSSALFSLDVEFDESKADESSTQTIYSSSLKPVLEEGQEQEVFIVSDDIILTKMSKGNRLKFVVEATLGSGSTHAKWSPCTGTSYKENDDGSFTFFIETSGVISADDVFMEAIDLLIEKLGKYV